MSNVYLFQGNPKFYDMDAYLATHPYIYWHCPNYKDQIQIGDKAILWRAGKDAGMIAIGEISEAPTKTKLIRYPNLLGQEYWADSETVSEDDIKVGIKISDVRLSPKEGLVSRDRFKTDPTVSSHRIIKNPTGTVFQIDDVVAEAMWLAWYGSDDIDITDTVPEVYKAKLEGNKKLMLHIKRERSSALRKAKVIHFLKSHKTIHCELCKVNLSDLYPAKLASGFIEVHHIKPISSLTYVSPTRFEDLILLCPNCHRMIHRTKEAEKNFKELKKWFACVFRFT